jgi:hypothetical protein
MSEYPPCRGVSRGCAVPGPRFTIRYRRARKPDRLAVVLEDAAGAPYRVSRRGRQFRLAPLPVVPRAAPSLVSRGWRRVPEVSPSSPPELRASLA